MRRCLRGFHTLVNVATGSHESDHIFCNNKCTIISKLLSFLTTVVGITPSAVAQDRQYSHLIEHENQ
jgi:hypothetical protein